MNSEEEEFDKRVQASLERARIRKKIQEAREASVRYEQERLETAKSKKCQWTWLKYSLVFTCVLFCTSLLIAVSAQGKQKVFMEVSATLLLASGVSLFVSFFLYCIYADVQF